jgi:glycosyltransferase involved in cell wall biosynthesis
MLLSPPSPKPSICFVALPAYNLLSSREDIGRTGGAEVQQVQIASWLAHQGYDVSFVTLDHGQPDGIDISGIKVYKAYAQEGGVRGLRFLHPRWSGLWAAMTRANADVYYQRGQGNETGQVALWCRLHRRSFVFGAASSADCDPGLSALKSRREKILYRIGLGLADAIVAQTRTQQHLLQRQRRISSVLVRSCGPALKNILPSGCRSSRDPSSMHVLWVGRISREKRFEWLLDVAMQCPHISFEVVGASNTDSDYSLFLTQRAGRMPNVRMHGRVPHSEMAGHYGRCHVLCCTSVYEGFPNTFLEAWALGIPVLSTFDPDDTIASNGLGWMAHNVEEMVACLRQLAQSPEIRLRASEAAKQYYLMNHTSETCLPTFERVLLDLAQAVCRPRRR